MLLQVLRLTQEQINQLPPAERDAILALVSSFCETYDDDRPTFISGPNLVVLHDGRRVEWCAYLYIAQSKSSSAILITRHYKHAHPGDRLLHVHMHVLLF